jgi:hypothetical protein
MIVSISFHIVLTIFLTNFSFQNLSKPFRTMQISFLEGTARIFGLLLVTCSSNLSQVSEYVHEISQFRISRKGYRGSWVKQDTKISTEYYLKRKLSKLIIN